MKAAVLHEYGGPGKLKYEEFPDPEPGPGEVCVRVLAASVNPVDWKMRSGEVREMFPVNFPGVLGRDMAGVVDRLGDGVTGFTEGDKVFALAMHTYAELCVVKAAELAHMPEGLDMLQASTVPLVSLTGHQLMREAAELQPGQTILLTGTTGSVGRCALFSALEAGAKVIAGVRKKQIEEAMGLGAVAAIDIDDEDEVERLGFLDTVADTVGGKIAPRLLAKIRPGGIYASVLGPPQNAVLHPLVRVKSMMAHPDPITLVHFGEALRDGKLQIPLERSLPLRDAAEAQAMAEKGGVGKVVLVP